MSDDKRPVRDIIEDIEKTIAEYEENDCHPEDDFDKDDYDKGFMYEELYRADLVKLLYLYKRVRNKILNEVGRIFYGGYSEHMKNDELLTDLYKVYRPFREITVDYLEYLENMYIISDDGELIPREPQNGDSDD